MAFRASSRARNILLAIIGLVAVAAVFTVVFSARLVTELHFSSNEVSDPDAASHFVIVTGSWADRAIVEQVYQGVQGVAASLECAVELRVPTNVAQNVPVSQLLEYASFACADGIIVVNSDEKLDISHIKDVHGKSIPVITVGQWSAGNTEISCISSNYYSIGKTAVRALMAQNASSVLILTDQTHAHYGVNSLVSSMQETFNEMESSLEVQMCTVDMSSVFVGEDALKSAIVTTEADVVISVTPELTALAAQALIDTNRTTDLKIIGLYQTERTREYLQKGMISALVSPDMELMGQHAIQEMASYLETGYCNSYRWGTVQLLERTHEQ